MPLLIDDKKFINLKFQYLEIPSKFSSKFQFIKSKDDYEKHKDDPNLQELNTGWKLLTWKEHNDIYSICIDNQTTADGQIKTNIDILKFREMKLKMCLKIWDLKDESGQPVPVNTGNIDHLHPVVATELLEGFENITELSETDQKK